MPAPTVARGQTGSLALQGYLDALYADLATLKSYTVAQLGAAPMLPAANDGKLVACSNGNAGQPCLAYSNGTNWKVIALGANVATS